MGNARWDQETYRSYSKSTDYVNKPREQVFSHSVNTKLDPRNVKVGKGDRVGLQLRESIISEENPNPTPIILGLDVTGSMGAVAEQIAKIELPKLMTAIHETGVVTDPHVMFHAIDDVFAQGHGALQVSYFEPDLKIVEQLRQMWIVGNGGGNGSESYDLSWYFAGNYTYLESYEKQDRPGFLFTFGDEPAPFATVTKRDLETIFGPGQYENTTPAASLKQAQKMYRVFHVLVEHGRYSSSARKSWVEMLGNNVIFLKDTSALTDVVLATMAISNGADMEAVIAESKNPEALRYAFSTVLAAQ